MTDYRHSADTLRIALSRLQTAAFDSSADRSVTMARAEGMQNIIQGAIDELIALRAVTDETTKPADPPASGAGVPAGPPEQSRKRRCPVDERAKRDKCQVTEPRPADPPPEPTCPSITSEDLECISYRCSPLDRGYRPAPGPGGPGPSPRPPRGDSSVRPPEPTVPPPGVVVLREGRDAAPGRPVCPLYDRPGRFVRFCVRPETPGPFTFGIEIS